MNNLDLFFDEEPAATPAVVPAVVSQPVRTGDVTISDCRAAAQKVSDRFGHFETTCLLQRFASDRVKDLPAALLLSFVNFAEACLHYAVPPSASWTDGVPTALKTL